MSVFDDLPPEDVQLIAQELRKLGWKVEPPDRSLVDELITERRQEAEQEDIPYVAIGAGERPPWADLPLHCPTCGEGPLPLQESDGAATGIRLRYISHCGGTWLRGGINV